MQIVGKFRFLSIPGSGGGGSSRSTAVTRAADKFRVVANLRMEGRWGVHEEGIMDGRVMRTFCVSSQ